MNKPKISKVEIYDEMPIESALLLYRFLEKVVLDTLPNYPICKGLFLSESVKEFNSIDELKAREKDEPKKEENSKI